MTRPRALRSMTRRNLAFIVLTSLARWGGISCLVLVLSSNAADRAREPNKVAVANDKGIMVSTVGLGGTPARMVTV